MSAFTRNLPAMYRLLGAAGSYVPAGGGAAVALTVLLDMQGGEGGLEGLMQASAPQIRVRQADVPAGIDKGATFTVSGVQWRARERAVPLLDGAEWAAPVARV